MIKNIKLENFQSHKDTDIKLSPGLNIIVGSSNQGKSSIMRAVKWAWKNRPVGTAQISHWAVKDEKQVEPCTTEIQLNNHTIKRIRTKDLNGYQVDGVELEAIKSDVPEEVNNAFNWTETNFQNQLDAPFLLSESSGAVAKYFNSVVDLSDIDTILKSAESDRRNNNREIKTVSSQTGLTEESLKKLEWVEKAKKKALELQKVQDTFNGIYEQIADLTDEKESYFATTEKVLQLNEIHVKPIEDKIKQHRELVWEKQAVETEEEEFQDKINTILKYDGIVKKDYSKITILVNNYVETVEALSDYETRIERLDSKIESLLSAVDKIGKYKVKIKEIEKQLPETCPTCGSVLRG